MALKCDVNLFDARTHKHMHAARRRTVCPAGTGGGGRAGARSESKRASYTIRVAYSTRDLRKDARRRKKGGSLTEGSIKQTFRITSTTHRWVVPKWTTLSSPLWPLVLPPQRSSPPKWEWVPKHPGERAHTHTAGVRLMTTVVDVCVHHGW